MTRNTDGISLEPARGGWTRANGIDNLTVMVRYTTGQKGRLQAGQILVTAQGLARIDVAAWRSVPIAELETLANLPENRNVIVAHLNDDDAEVHIGDGAKDVQPVLAVRRTRHSLRLPKPTGRRFPDSFYERVADAYRTAVTLGEPPGQKIAEVNNVPTTTTRRWFAEARRRGFLEPAQGMGRVG